MARPKQVAVRAAALAALALTAGGCTALDDTLAKIPFFSFMVESPAFDPYEAPRPTPAHSVPFAVPGGVAPVERPEGVVTEQWLQSLTAMIENPFPMNETTIAAGQSLYQTQCFVCHGAAGQGDGPVIQPGQRFPFAPSLTTPRAVGLSDEYIYGIIWVGRGIMPAYGSRVQNDERWLIVNYVRSLQQAAAGGAAAAPEGE